MTDTPEARALAEALRDSWQMAVSVVDTDQMRGRFYRCPCGWQGWTVWGHAIRHAQKCEKAR